jgi:neutral ceramidase
LAGVPAEITTMAGRRLREDVQDVFKRAPDGIGSPVTDVLVTAYSNAYSGYITTKEEYDVQHYEGASTLFGPLTARAYRQEFVSLAKTMRDDQDAHPGPTPSDLTSTADKKKLEFPTGNKPAFGPHKFGDLIGLPKGEYRRGEVVTVTFITADPFLDKKNIDTFMTVLKNVGAASNPHWERRYSDRDESTVVHWTRFILDSFQFTVSWTIPKDAETGQYKIRHIGSFRKIHQGKPVTFSRATPVFEVKA